jgi:hypothetical protein
MSKNVPECRTRKRCSAEGTVVEASDVIRWLLAVPLGLFGTWVIGCNFACVYLGLVRGKHHSLTPLLGGTCVGSAWLLCPAAGGRSWAWIPLAVDPGGLLLLLLFVSALLAGLFRGGTAEPGATTDRAGGER